MAGTASKFNSYRVPSDGIQRNRRVFYGLRRKSDETISQWLNRAQSYISHCEFSTYKEFLLIDRFVCGLNANELESIKNVNKTWTVKQLLKHVNSDIDSRPIAAELVIDNSININENQDIKSESVGSFLGIWKKNDFFFNFRLLCLLRSIVSLKNQSSCKTIHWSALQTNTKKAVAKQCKAMVWEWNV